MEFLLQNLGIYMVWVQLFFAVLSHEVGEKSNIYMIFQSNFNKTA